MIGGIESSAYTASDMFLWLKCLMDSANRKVKLGLSVRKCLNAMVLQTTKTGTSTSETQGREESGFN
jgi:hypothetical protein